MTKNGSQEKKNKMKRIKGLQHGTDVSKVLCWNLCETLSSFMQNVVNRITVSVEMFKDLPSSGETPQTVVGLPAQRCGTFRARKLDELTIFNNMFY